jgi:hypothetical protein
VSRVLQFLTDKKMAMTMRRLLIRARFSSSSRAHRQPPPRSYTPVVIVGLVIAFSGAFATLALRPQRAPLLPLKGARPDAAVAPPPGD